MARQLGPVLQFRGNNDAYCVSALVVLDRADPAPAGQLGDQQQANVRCLAEIPFENPAYKVWRLDFRIAQGAAAARYDYRVAEVAGSFVVPGRDDMPRLAYGSCNGFSDPKLMKQVADHNERWRHLAGLHAANPYHLLLLGGDQVYSDAMWKQVSSLAGWLEQPAQKRFDLAFTRDMARQLDSYFCRMYLERWSRPEIATVLAGVPSVMMWDDHDIMDGWGSYPRQQHYSAVYQGIYAVARRYFRLLQLQCAADEAHPAALAAGEGCHLAFGQLGGMALLVPDLRSERQPAGDAGQPEQIISAQGWQAIYGWLDGRQQGGDKHLLLMSSIPVAYLDLGSIERMLNTLPGQQELEDDLRDHWSSEPHLQERKRLIHRLFDHAAAKGCRITILSGDVHVGALSVLESTRQPGAARGQSIINQLVSTGIVHPAPPAIARFVLEQLAGKVEQVDQGITASMLPIASRSRYLIGARNWLAVEPDADKRLWCNWHVEGMATPLTKVVHPA
ncbi:alkaline phosphatase D family protein [Vogesella sp. LIG4]|uniref:alkaline phosphatase D family protein n=1 Tax=Vogesella sp. LIG4 TaxID=1192162 RepID=UPI00082001A4|nr:alkaline phosphatase D family protein [Vogesella sp. LIG4]SCK21503.1 PhoD-like phosphatase [Vogesella sp. LIG4]